MLIQPNIFYSLPAVLGRLHARTGVHTRQLAPIFWPASSSHRAAVEKRFLPLTLKSALPKSYWLTKTYLHLPWRPMAGQMLVVATRG